MKLLEKQQKQSIDSCELCVVLHTFAHFRFSIGLGSFHGEWINNEEKSAVGKFMELILGWKKKTNSRLYAAKDISQLHKYFSNLAQMSIQLHEILLKIEDFANRLKNLGEKKERAFVPQNNLRLKKIQNSRKCVSTSWPKFKTACQELAHLATVSAENRELQQEHQEVAQVPKIENGSGILYQQEFYESLVRPDMSVQEKLEQKMNQNAEINVFTKLFNERATMAEKVSSLSTNCAHFLNWSEEIGPEECNSVAEKTDSTPKEMLYVDLEPRLGNNIFDRLWYVWRMESDDTFRKKLIELSANYIISVDFLKILAPMYNEKLFDEVNFWLDKLSLDTNSSNIVDEIRGIRREEKKQKKEKKK
ncbi:unnamed protein product [Caenorhabditis angaria]|uniref:Uncharacterized protein n=1 Tax=Caenorhabditis angaria TaxID=860376 RepID=A0A9P1IEB5_9PELO|nr:unnamed protein product [Caenorhabditis angaria]